MPTELVLNDVYIQVYCSIVITHNFMNTTKITSILSIKPTSATNHGDQLLRHSKSIDQSNLLNVVTIAPHSTWWYSTKDLLDSLLLSRHIELVLTTFTDKKNPLKRLREKGCNSKLLCFIGSKYFNPSAYFDVKLLHNIVELGLDLDIDVYF